jgi:hypothetical protein
MEYPWWPSEVDALIDRTKEAALAEPDFARRLFEDANAAVKERFGVDLPVKVRLVMATEQFVALVPADMHFEAGGELSDELLDLVSAGSCVGPQPPPSVTA